MARCFSSSNKHSFLALLLLGVLFIFSYGSAYAGTWEISQFTYTGQATWTGYNSSSNQNETQTLNWNNPPYSQNYVGDGAFYDANGGIRFHIIRKSGPVSAAVNFNAVWTWHPLYPEDIPPRVAVLVIWRSAGAEHGEQKPEVGQVILVENPERNNTITLPAPVTISASSSDPTSTSAWCHINAGPIAVGIAMGRHQGSINPLLDGASSVKNTDPTYTRWLPLAFTPQVNTQPFRVPWYDTNAASGVPEIVGSSLPTPWGNINCNYSINLRRAAATDSNTTGN